MEVGLTHAAGFASLEFPSCHRVCCCGRGGWQPTRKCPDLVWSSLGVSYGERVAATTPTVCKGKSKYKKERNEIYPYVQTTSTRSHVPSRPVPRADVRIHPSSCRPPSLLLYHRSGMCVSGWTSTYTASSGDRSVNGSGLVYTYGRRLSRGLGSSW